MAGVSALASHENPSSVSLLQVLFWHSVSLRAEVDGASAPVSHEYPPYVSVLQVLSWHSASLKAEVDGL